MAHNVVVERLEISDVFERDLAEHLEVDADTLDVLEVDADAGACGTAEVDPVMRWNAPDAKPLMTCWNEGAGRCGWAFCASRRWSSAW